MNRLSMWVLAGIMAGSSVGGVAAVEGTPIASPPSQSCVTIPDLRDTSSRLWTLLDSCYTITGTMDNLHVAEEGYVYDIVVNDLDDRDTKYRTYFILRATDANGNRASINVATDDPLNGMNDGDAIVVTGEFLGEVDGTTVFGKKTTLPFMEAWSVELQGTATPVPD